MWRVDNIRYIEGQVYGRLTVLSLSRKSNYKVYWLCKCMCGNEIEVYGGNLRNGHTQSCGCLLAEANNKRLALHLKSLSKEYKSWQHMKYRCLNPKSAAYKYYGGRGIKVYEPWIESFQAFLDYVGSAPTKYHSIDRINTNGNYEPGNVKWSTEKEQQNNRNNNVFITYKGETKNISQWAKALNMNYTGLRRRLQSWGWSVERAFTTPLKVNFSEPIRPKKSRQLSR